MHEMKRYKVFRIALIIITLFVGIGAFGGGLAMLIEPSGKSVGFDALLPYFQVLPFANVLFQNFLFPGAALIIVNGITNFVSAFLLFNKKKSGIISGMIFGITLMAWITIQFVIFPPNPLSIIYFCIGFVQFVVGYVCLVSYKQAYFSFDEFKYKNIQEHSSVAVVYFSRTKRTKKIAYEIANSFKTEIHEIKTIDNIEGTLGFWWCGRYGMHHKWGMPIQKMDIDVSKYERVILCSPMWVCSLASPAKQFLIEHKGKFKSVEYVITHFNPFFNKKLYRYCDSLCETKHARSIDIISALGHTSKPRREK